MKTQPPFSEMCSLLPLAATVTIISVSLSVPVYVAYKYNIGPYTIDKFDCTAWPSVFPRLVIGERSRLCYIPLSLSQRGSLQQEPTEYGNTDPWLADNQSRDINNEFWLVVYLCRSVPVLQSCHLILYLSDERVLLIKSTQFTIDNFPLLPLPFTALKPAALQQKQRLCNSSVEN